MERTRLVAMWFALIAVALVAGWALWLAHDAAERADRAERTTKALRSDLESATEEAGDLRNAMVAIYLCSANRPERAMSRATQQQACQEADRRFLVAPGGGSINVTEGWSSIAGSATP